MLKLIAPAIVLCLLAGISIDKASRHKIPPGVDDYHARVRAAVDSIPYVFGDWVGVDTEIRQEALRILDANVSLSRRYRNINTGQSATLLLVHSQDARSLLGHYPPVCYPSQGWTQLSASTCSIPSSPAPVRATEYAFAYETLEQSARIGVVHFTVLPDGRTSPDMGLLEVAARDNRVKYLGGASVQFILDSNLPSRERDDVCTGLVEAISSWMETVEAGLDGDSDKTEAAK